MAFYPNSSSIVAKPFAFDETYVPDRLVGREQEIEKLRTCIEPARRNLTPLNCWLYGPSGSGKTSVVQSVLHEAQSQFGLRWAYVNCWQTPTYYLVLDRLVEHLRVLGAEAQIAKVKANAIVRALENQPLAVVLDELDMVTPRERASILYNLGQLGKVAVYCITYTGRSLAGLDSRVRSRLNCHVIELHQYERPQIVEVLKQRAEIGLFPGVWSDDVLARIADISEGNSRTAIQTLRSAAFLAERKRSPRLLVDHVNECWTGTGDLRKQHMLDALTPHHRLILTVVQEQGAVASGNLWRLYREACDGRSLQPVALRTYNHYLRKLVALRLLIEEIVIDKGRRRMFAAARSEMR
jgi:cell division control protein 6